MSNDWQRLLNQYEVILSLGRQHGLGISSRLKTGGVLLPAYNLLGPYINNCVIYFFRNFRTIFQMKIDGYRPPNTCILHIKCQIQAFYRS